MKVWPYVLTFEYDLSMPITVPSIRVDGGARRVTRCLLRSRCDRLLWLYGDHSCQAPIGDG